MDDVSRLYLLSSNHTTLETLSKLGQQQELI